MTDQFSSSAASIGEPEALSILRTTVLGLQATGRLGFEGFLATILEAITSCSVRIVKSGFQGGRDAELTAPDRTLMIEGKLYSGILPRSEIEKKLGQLLGGDDAPDLWIAGTTAEVDAGIAKSCLRYEKSTGIAIEILDWQAGSPAPRLAAFCLLAKDSAHAFLLANGKSAVGTQLSAAFATLDASPALQTAKRQLAERLSSANIGLANAQRANADWLGARFDSADRAKASFGQKLSPRDRAVCIPRLLPRTELIGQIVQAVFQSAPATPVIIHGTEGLGKSWAFAMAWLDAVSPPLALVVTADKALHLLNQPDLCDPLAQEFVAQTGAAFPDLHKPVWLRRFERWRTAGTPKTPRFVLYLDGIDQRAEAKWATLILELQDFCSQRGGQLVISVRTQFYERLKGRLPTKSRQIELRPWNSKELAQVLGAADLRSSDLQPNVAALLRTPRLSALAFAFRERGLISDFRELTMAKLLHAQIADQGDPEFDPIKFEGQLRADAEETLNRLLKEQPDPHIIRPDASRRFSALESLVSDGYYESAGDGSDSIDIRPQALTLGLALSLLQQLKGARKKSRDVDALCAERIDAINALDQAADIVFEALVLSTTDPNADDAVVHALLEATLNLQNLSDAYFDAFCGCGRRRPDAFLAKLADTLACSDAMSRHDWLIGCVANFTSDPVAAGKLSAFIISVLNTHSLNPRLSARGKEFSAPDSCDIETRRVAIETKLSALTDYERTLLKGMKTDADLRSYDLIEDALRLLIFLPLQPFVPSLTHYVLGTLLNAPIFHRREIFLDLVRFNLHDWHETRAAILRQISSLEQAHPSAIGQRLIATLLDATGAPDDCEKSKQINYDLAEPEWRARMDEPRSRRPDDPSLIGSACMGEHLEQITGKLGAIDLQFWRDNLSIRKEDHDIEEHLPYLIRFAPGKAIAFQRRLFDETASRQGMTLRMAAFAILPDAAALAENQENTLCEKALTALSVADEGERRPVCIEEQFLLLAALAGQSGDAKWQALSRIPGHIPLLLSFDDLLEAGSALQVSAALDRALDEDKPDGLVRVLRLVASSARRLDNAVRQKLDLLLAHENGIVRAYAMDAIRISGDEAAISRFCQSPWSAVSLLPSGAYFERWFGGRLLIAGAQKAQLSADQLLSRVLPEHFAEALAALGPSIAPVIIENVNQILAPSLKAESAVEPPLITRQHRASSEPHLLFASLSDPPQKQSDPLAALRELEESDETFQNKQDARSQVHQRFLDDLTLQNASTLLNGIGLNVLEACVHAAPQTVSHWADLVLDAPVQALRIVKPFGLEIASALAASDPERSIKVFRRLKNIQGFVQMKEGWAGIEYEAIALWKAAASPGVARLCFTNLDRSHDDDALSREVIAAEMCDQQELLDEYVSTRVDSGHPLKIARALTLSGFASEPLMEVDPYLKTAGPIGVAARYAQASQKRYESMIHWHGQMAASMDREAFWCAGRLFLETVDARFELAQDPEGGGAVAQRFFPILREQIERRIRQRQKERQKTLFGARPPRIKLFADDT